MGSVWCSIAQYLRAGGAGTAGGFIAQGAHLSRTFASGMCAVEEVPMGGLTEAQFYSAVGQ
jgi:hypothetical protein